MKENNISKGLYRRAINHQVTQLKDGVLEIESRLIVTKAYDTHIGFDRPLKQEINLYQIINYSVNVT